jgi:hypothetical protein
MIRTASTFKAILVCIAVSAISLTFLRPAQAQEKEEMNRPITTKGSAAFMFTIVGLAPFNVSGPGIGSPLVIDSAGEPIQVPLTGAGFKYFFADDMALRIGLGFNTFSNGADSLAGGANTTTAFGIAVGFEDHPRALYTTSPYFGGQVSYSHGSTENKKIISSKDYTTKNSANSISVGALAGFDWFIARAVAIGAEVNLGFTTTSSSTEITDITPKTTTTDHPSASGIALSTQGLVHVVVYF